MYSGFLKNISKGGDGANFWATCYCLSTITTIMLLLCLSGAFCNSNRASCLLSTSEKSLAPSSLLPSKIPTDIYAHG